SGPGPHNLALSSMLPPVTEALIIDGYWQGRYTSNDPSDDARANTLAVGNNAVLKIELTSQKGPDGKPLVDNGLILAAPGVVVRGLAINGFNKEGIVITSDGVGVDGSDTIEGCFIGTNHRG